MPEIKNTEFSSLVEDSTPHTSDEELAKILGVIPGYEDLNTDKPKEEEVTNDVVTLDSNIKLPEDIVKKEENPFVSIEEPPKEQQQQQEPIQTVASYTEEQLREAVANAVLESEQKWENIRTSFEEFQKDPYRFYAKYSPHIIEKFDDAGWVQSKLTEEFGDDFVFDQSQMQVYGTPSNKYMRRQLELAQEAEGIRKAALETKNESANQSVEQLNNYKKQVIDKHKITNEVEFDQTIWKEINSYSTVDVYDKLVELALLKQKLDTIKNNAGRVPQNTFPSTPGVTQINGNVPRPALTDEDKSLMSIYSEDAIKNLKLIR